MILRYCSAINLLSQLLGVSNFKPMNSKIVSRQAYARMAAMMAEAPKTRIIFMGSPDFALPSLTTLAENYTVAGVVTQPDRPAGRGRKLISPAVMVFANRRGLPSIQPRRLKEPQAMEQLMAWQPELIVVAAFGQILRQEVLDLPAHGCINVHASLLPRWRGAAPIHAAILHGDAETGVTIMRMDAGLDTGPILAQRAIPIAEEETASTLSAKLADLGAELLLHTLPSYLAGDIEPQPQDDSQATYAPMLKKAEGALDFSKPAQQLARQIRAFHPWPGSFVQIGNKPLKVLSAHAIVGESPDPGTRAIIEGLPAIATADGWLLLDEVQPAGKKPMSGADYLRGVRGWADR